MTSILRAPPWESFPTREAYGLALAALGGQYHRLVVLDADLMGSTKTDKFAEQFPDRFFQVGISEADMVGTAAGLAHEGFLPFASSFAIFLTGKTYDQVRQSISYSKNNVKLVSTHAGFQAGPDGATHQGLEDIALMRTMPGMTVLAPADAVETRKAVEALINYDRPAYMRLGRSGWPVLFDDSYQLEIGRSTTLRSGNDLTLIGYGQMVSYLLEAARELAADGIQARVLNFSTIKPLDGEALTAAAEETGGILIAEEHQLNGGLGEAIAGFLADRRPTPMRFVAVLDRFGESGRPEQLMADHGLTTDMIVRRARELVRRGQTPGRSSG